ncbi:MAG: DUF1566 domain-containing protein [Nitrososphaerales archaeon]|jgi:hypothetical protein
MSDILWRFIPLIVSHQKLIETASAVLGFIAAAATLLRSIILFIARRLRHRRLQPLVKERKYLAQVIKQATYNYIEPNCQSVDPSGQEDFRKVIAAKQPAFAALDEILDTESDNTYTIVLADTGMGKTSLLLNYYSRHLRRRKQEFRLALVPLGQQRASEQIEQVQNQDETTLLLDALDEDPQAIGDPRKRLGELLQLAARFRHVVLTCRTQFFNRDDEIPRETGLIRTGITRSGEDKEYVFHKVYLSPFSDRQVNQLIAKAFPLWKWGARQKAKKLVRKMPDLVVRPMLLAHVEDLIHSRTPIRTAADLYNEMVSSWLAREKHFADPKALREFSEVLAADVYLNRRERGSEKLPKADAEALAKELEFNLSGWQIAGRSLLNRDSEGNLKFSHRSFMEYLFVNYFLRCPKNVGKTEWTDQMKVFWWELKYLSSFLTVERGPLTGPLLVAWDETRTYADITALDKLHLPPLINLRREPQQMSCEQVSEYVQLMTCESTNEAMCRLWPQLYVPIPATARDLGTGDDAVLDVVTGLMWESKCSLKAVPFEATAKRVTQLNMVEHMGFSDWRIPTIAEILSLLPTNPDSEPDTRIAAFDNLHGVLWTNDTDNLGKSWRIDVTSRNLRDLRTVERIQALQGPAYIRAVRTHDIWPTIPDH